MHEWKDLRGLIEYPKAGVLSRDIRRSESENVSLFCMAAGTEIGDHSSPMDAEIRVIEGDGEFTLSGRSVRMAPGTVVMMGRNEVHSLRALENTSFVLTLRR